MLSKHGSLAIPLIVLLAAVAAILLLASDQALHV
jgi:hypothetical protein